MKCILFILVLLFSSNLYGGGVDYLVKKLSIAPGKKATIQWERIFSNKRKMKKYKIDTLNKEQQKVLKIYILNHSADSDVPELAGEFL